MESCSSSLIKGDKWEVAVGLIKGEYRHRFSQTIPPQNFPEEISGEDRIHPREAMRRIFSVSKFAKTTY